jgi:hypothetical protein
VEYILVGLCWINGEQCCDFLGVFFRLTRVEDQFKIVSQLLKHFLCKLSDRDVQLEREESRREESNLL